MGFGVALGLGVAVGLGVALALGEGLATALLELPASPLQAHRLRARRAAAARERIRFTMMTSFLFLFCEC